MQIYFDLRSIHLKQSELEDYFHHFNFKQFTLDKSLFVKARANPSEYVLLVLLVVVGGCFGEWAPFSTQTRRRAAQRTPLCLSPRENTARREGREKGINSDGVTSQRVEWRERERTEEGDGLMDDGKRAVLIPYAPAEPSHEIRGCKFESSGWEEGMHKCRLSEGV